MVRQHLIAYHGSGYVVRYQFIPSARPHIIEPCAELLTSWWNTRIMPQQISIRGKMNEVVDLPSKLRKNVN